jgi:hypothetical protein
MNDIGSSLPSGINAVSNWKSATSSSNVKQRPPHAEQEHRGHREPDHRERATLVGPLRVQPQLELRERAERAHEHELPVLRDEAPHRA